MMVGRAGQCFGVGVACAILAASGNAWCEEGETPHRDVLSVEETHGAPQGFHAERQTRWGLIIAGAATTGLGALMLGTGLQQHAENEQRTGMGSDPGSGGEFFIIAGSISMAAGIPMLVYGLVSPRDVYVRDRPRTLSLGLSPNPRHFGASLSLTF
ncbi:MAG TPA: hypothetical protein VHB79_34105 [Polyangiaceae bacterium]|nr:hypothetical protein [Polyangiaceae bacterium]